MTQVATGSSTSAEMAVAAAAQGGKPARKGLAELVEQNMAEIERALPPGVMEPERFARIIMTEFRKTPKLLVCTPESFLGALFQTAQLGLEPGGQLGHAFLIPYDNSKLGVTECQLQIGYKGLIELAGRRGILLRSREVRGNDEFAFDLGSNEFLRHSWKLGDDRGDVIGYYGKATMPDGKVTFHVMDKGEINERRNRSSAVRSGRKGPWDTDYSAMARKTVLRAMTPQIALAPELQTAIKADEAIIERSAKGDLSYLYRDAIDVGQIGQASPGKDDVTNAINDIADNHQRLACSKYLVDNFGPIEGISDAAAMACLKIAQEWPAVLTKDQAPTTPIDMGEQRLDFGKDAEGILNELDDELRAQASIHLGNWVAAQREVPGGDATALELERWLREPMGAAQSPQEAPDAPAGAEDQAPPPAAQGDAPGGVSQEILDKLQTAIGDWPIESVKTKLREFSQPATGNEKTCRTRLLMTFAPLYAAGNEAVTGLFN